MRFPSAVIYDLYHYHLCIYVHQGDLGRGSAFGGKKENHVSLFMTYYTYDSIFIILENCIFSTLSYKAISS